MSKYINKLKKQKYVSVEEPKSLSPDPMTMEAKQAAVLVAPLIIGLAAFLWILKYVAMTQEEFLLVGSVSMVTWVVYMVGIFAYFRGRAVEYKLHDREFGFTPRLRPRFEVYCLPQDIRCLIDPTKDNVQNEAQLVKRLDSIGFKPETSKELAEMIKPERIEESEPITPELSKKLAEIMKGPYKFYMYYFAHKDSFPGWNAQTHTTPTFKSHVVLMPHDYDKQFIFGSGQENWFGPIMYNHPAAESDNVKVLFWTLDPFTNEDMPVCALVHCSRLYDVPTPKMEDPTMQDAVISLIAVQHGTIEEYRKGLIHIKHLLDAKFHGDIDTIKYGQDVAKYIIKLWKETMKDVPSGIWSRLAGWQKVVTLLVIVVGVCVLGYLMLNWLKLLPWNTATEFLRGLVHG